MSQSATEDAPALIRRIADDAGFDDAIGDLAVTIFENAVDADAVEPDVERSDDGKFSGNDRRFPPAVYPAAVYAAARVRDIPTKPSEVADASPDDPDEDDVANRYKAMLRTIPFEVEPESPTDWVRRICDDLNVGPKFEVDAVDLSEDAIDAGLHVGKSVSGFAAAVVYATSKHRDADVEQADVLALRDGAREPGNPDDIHFAVNDLCDRIDGLPSKVRADAIDLAKRALDDDVDFVTRTDPKGVAAGFVYVAAKDARVDVSQTEVAEKAYVSKSTVVNRVNDVRDWRKRSRFDGVNYNRLKELAADAGLDVGQAPERDYLIDRLAAAGVEP